MNNARAFILPFLLLVTLTAYSLQGQEEVNQENRIITGAEQMEVYLPWLMDKSVAVAGNHTSLVGSSHLVDTLISRGIQVVKVFSPEHGFRGKADAGSRIESGQDPATGLPIISLYGKHKKPTPEDLNNIDIVVFDIQDVGARFYTYISTMTYIMEACAENNIPLLILDRPNPNGHYVDGPVLDTAYRSFVGMHTVPVVHGMTLAEYAFMVNTEGWLKNGIQCEMQLVLIKNYDHNTPYTLPLSPSPNLKNMNAIYLYPSLCFFEGSILSIGRGTDHPFEILGHPDYMIGSYTFTPRSMEGAEHPKYEGVQCFGTSLIGFTVQNDIPDKINLSWLMAYYKYFKSKDFFNNYFDILAGSSRLREQIVSGLSEEEIRASWQKELNAFRELRKQYLLYKQ